MTTLEGLCPWSKSKAQKQLALIRLKSSLKASQFLIGLWSYLLLLPHKPSRKTNKQKKVDLGKKIICRVSIVFQDSTIMCQTFQTTGPDDRKQKRRKQMIETDPEIQTLVFSDIDFNSN